MNLIELEDETSAGEWLEMPEVAATLEEYLEALRQGRPVDRDAFVARHAEFAGQLAGYLDALEWIQSVGRETTPPRDAEANPSPLGPGDTLGGFRILQEVGRGGMGVVYEAEQLGLPERRVALKVLARAGSLDPRTFQRFRVETQAAACLNHPNIVPIYSAGCERDIPFYAMPLIKGRALAEMLGAARARPEESALTPRSGIARGGSGGSWPVVVAHLGAQAADALEHAHGLGVIHRDIKPSNLIVDTDWRLWVADFGLARLARNDPGLTDTGELVGTLRYISPEQVRGEPGAGDARSDIYALGATLYEALTLRPLFGESDRSALLHRILHAEPPHPRSIDPSIPRDLETIILKSTDKLPSGRYATARDLAEDLRRFLEDRPILARRPGLVERSVRWARRHRALLATAVVGILLSMVIGTITLWQGKREVEATLTKVNEARAREKAAHDREIDAQTREFVAFMKSFGVNDMVAVPLLREATARGIWDPERSRQAYAMLIQYYDQVARSLAREGRKGEVIAQAFRRAGGLRMAIGDRRGLDDLERAIGQYEAIAAKSPASVWYRTDLISTLREYAGHLGGLGDPRAASTRRRACAVADGLVADERARARCFRMEVRPQLQALGEMLSAFPDATPAGRSLAARMTKWLEENPEPTDGAIYLPRP